MSQQERPELGANVHYNAAAETGPCRLAVLTALPATLSREPYDGCPNGSSDEWIADLMILGPRALDFRERVDWAGSPSIDGYPEDATEGTWHTADQCKEA
jgi:hypothetical protein